MTIASEITRLQWAKSDARTSIINKGVDVPASAKLDTYHDYIDLIKQWYPWEVVDWLKLANYHVTWEPRAPRVWLNVSFYDDNVAYGCVLARDWIYYNIYNRYLIGYRKRKWYDIEYVMGWVWSSDSKFWSMGEMQCYKNATSVRFFYTFSYVNNPYTWNVSYFIVQVDWDYKNFSTPVATSSTEGTSLNISDYTIDTTWYTQVTTSEWVKSVTPTESSSEWFIYLTLGEITS